MVSKTYTIGDGGKDIGEQAIENLYKVKADVLGGSENVCIEATKQEFKDTCAEVDDAYGEYLKNDSEDKIVLEPPTTISGIAEEIGFGEYVEDGVCLEPYAGAIFFVTEFRDDIWFNSKCIEHLILSYIVSQGYVVDIPATIDSDTSEGGVSA